MQSKKNRVRQLCQIHLIYFYLAGDQAIRRSAQILSTLFRATDIIGRLGGDEFIIFLSGSLTETLIQKKAASICENLQLALGASINLTASVGVYMATDFPQQFEDLSANLFIR